MAYADIKDLERRWRNLTPSEDERAQALLEDNSEVLRALLIQAGIDVTDPSEEYLGVLRYVVCMATARMLKTPADQPALNSLQQMAGPYQSMQSFANPSGDFYLTRTEKTALGLTGTRIVSVKPQIGGR